MTPARVKPHTFGLRVTFERDGREQDQRIAPTGREAVKTALMILVAQDYLQAGDRLVIDEVPR